MHQTYRLIFSFFIFASALQCIALERSAEYQSVTLISADVLASTKHAISRSRPILGLETIARPISTSGLETMTESRPWSSGLESRDRDQDLDKMNSSALEPRDHGLEITTLIFAHDISSSIGVTFIGI